MLSLAYELFISEQVSCGFFGEQIQLENLCESGLAGDTKEIDEGASLQLSQLLNDSVVAEHVQNDKPLCCRHALSKFHDFGVVLGIDVWDEQHLVRLALVELLMALLTAN